MKPNDQAVDRKKGSAAISNTPKGHPPTHGNPSVSVPKTSNVRR